MRTTIDAAGRVVIPKALRDEAGLAPGTEIEVELRDGRIEIEPAMVPMRVVKRGGSVVIEPVGDVELPPLTTEDVRDLLERVRR
jgi:AbrB family looped-hinge helix DNA binding protein